MKTEKILLPAIFIHKANESDIDNFQIKNENSVTICSKNQ